MRQAGTREVWLAHMHPLLSELELLQSGRLTRQIGAVDCEQSPEHARPASRVHSRHRLRGGR